MCFSLNKKGCGGTTLNYNGSTITSVTTYETETAWSGSNGGYSLQFNRPSYQNGVLSNTKRGVPDIAAVANPSSGYAICYNGSCSKFGGIFIYLIKIGKIMEIFLLF